jgi:hypothetical protein
VGHRLGGAGAYVPSESGENPQARPPRASIGRLMSGAALPVAVARPVATPEPPRQRAAVPRGLHPSTDPKEEPCAEQNQENDPEYGAATGAARFFRTRDRQEYRVRYKKVRCQRSSEPNRVNGESGAAMRSPAGSSSIGDPTCLSDVLIFIVPVF